MLKLRKLNEKFAVVCSRSQQSLEFGQFILMFCRARQRNVPKFKTHVQNCYFCSLNRLCCGVFTVTTTATAHSGLIEGFGGKRALGFLIKIELCRKRSKFRLQFCLGALNNVLYVFC